MVLKVVSLLILRHRELEVWEPRNLPASESLHLPSSLGWSPVAVLGTQTEHHTAGVNAVKGWRVPSMHCKKRFERKLRIFLHVLESNLF